MSGAQLLGHKIGQILSFSEGVRCVISFVFSCIWLFIGVAVFEKSLLMLEYALALQFSRNSIPKGPWMQMEVHGKYGKLKLAALVSLVINHDDAVSA